MEPIPFVLISGTSLILGSLLLPAIAYLLLFLSGYKKSTYYKDTRIPYFSHDLGERGEYRIFRRLQGLERKGCRFLFNVYIPKGSDGTTEIDILLIHPKGIFVFESKNYRGWIFGKETDRHWTQSLPKGRRRSHKERFYNPLKQNSSHIKHLRRLLLDLPIPMWSVIVFSDRCTLKKLTLSPGTPHEVVRLSEVRKAVSRISRQAAADALSQGDIDDIHDFLHPYSQADEETKRRHIERLESAGSKAAPSRRRRR